MHSARLTVATVLVAVALVGAGCGGVATAPGEQGARQPEVLTVTYPRPVALAADDSGVWVLDERGRLGRLNAEGHFVVRPRPAAGPKLPRDVDALVRVGDELWVADAARGLLRFDARSGRPLGDGLQRAKAVALTASGSTVWSVNDFSGTLRSLDVSTLRLSEPRRFGATLRGVAATLSRVWVVDQDGGTLTSVDARRRTVGRRAAADGTRPFHVAVAGARVWMSDDDGVTAYDADSLRRVGRWTAAVGSTPYVAVDRHGAWAVSATESVLVRLDSAARPIRRISLPSAGYSAAVAGRVVWVATDRELYRVTT